MLASNVLSYLGVAPRRRKMPMLFMSMLGKLLLMVKAAELTIAVESDVPFSSL